MLFPLTALPQTDGIDQLAADPATTTPRPDALSHRIYDLQGRTIPASRMTKGVYIVNGRKRVVR